MAMAVPQAIPTLTRTPRNTAGDGVLLLCLDPGRLIAVASGMGVDGENGSSEGLVGTVAEIDGAPDCGADVVSCGGAGSRLCARV